MKTLGNIVRYIIYVPAMLLVIAAIFTLFIFLIPFLLSALSNIQEKTGTFWFIIILLFIGFAIIGWLWGWFKILCGLIVLWLGKISPSSIFQVYAVSIITTICMIIDIYSVWVAPEDYTGLTVFISVVLSLMVIGLGWALIFASLLNLKEEQRN